MGLRNGQMARICERAKTSEGSQQGELRELIGERSGTPRSLTLDEIVAKVSRLGLKSVTKLSGRSWPMGSGRQGPANAPAPIFCWRLTANSV